MTDLPIIIGPAGVQPRSPADILAQLIALVIAVRPGYTANLPASMIDDISATDTYAISLMDQGVVELINSLTPLGANVFLLNQLGQMLGVAQGQTTNTSVYVTFRGPAGYVIPVGFTVSDGSFQYTVQDGGVIATGGVSSPLFCLASLPGSWAIPQGIVTQIVTSVPATVIPPVTCTNPEAGIPGAGQETEASYRARVLQANLAEGQGMAGYLKTLLQKVSGVQPRLVSVVQQVGGGFTVVCGSGDPYEVAYAIYSSLFDFSILSGSILAVVNISNDNPGVVTTSINHNYTTGQQIVIVGVLGMTAINNITYTATVISPTQFSIGVNTSAFGEYLSGGIVTPNLRNIVVTLQDYPDVYTIPFVNPPQQQVSILVTWNTDAPNFVSSAAVATLANPAIVSYINTLPSGQPINTLAMQSVFGAAIASVLSPALLSRLLFQVSIDGFTATPIVGSTLIPGDPESYFLTSTPQVIINQG